MLIHTVAPGETLTSIAADYNLTASYLERINELPNEEALVVGQDIVIAYTDTIHTVSEGDTLTALSERYGLSIDPDAIIEDISVGMQQRTEILNITPRIRI